MAEALHHKDVLSEWGQVIYGARGMQEELFTLIVQHLEDIEVEGLTWVYETFSEKVGMFTGKTKGISRKCLVIQAGTQPFSIVVGAWDFGKYLAIRRLIWMKKVRENDPRLWSEDFLRDDISSLYTTVVHGAIVSAVEDLIEGSDIEKDDVHEVLKAW